MCLHSYQYRHVTAQVDWSPEEKSTDKEQHPWHTVNTPLTVTFQHFSPIDHKPVGYTVTCKNYSHYKIYTRF